MYYKRLCTLSEQKIVKYGKLKLNTNKDESWLMIYGKKLYKNQRHG